MNRSDFCSEGRERCIGTVNPLGEDNQPSEGREAEDEEEAQEEADEGEARILSGHRAVKKPSIQEVESHRVSHMP